ncbi:MAG: GtrA family protein [Pseudomonadota bacterium]
MNEKIRFLVVGAYNTAFGYAAFAGLYLWFKESLHYLILVAVAHLFAVVNAFLTQRRIVFNDRSPMLAAFLRFNVATTLSLLLSLTGMALLVDGIGINPLIGQAIVTILSVIGIYVLHRHYTFRQR